MVYCGCVQEKDPLAIMIRLLSPLLILACIYAALPACNNSAEQEPAVMPRDTSISRDQAYNTLFIDSLRMESFIDKEKILPTIANELRSFYNQRNYQLAWFDSSGLSEHASSFLEMQHQYINYAQDSSIYHPLLAKLRDSLEQGVIPVHPDSLQQMLNLELQLTNAFFRYAEKAYEGNTDLRLQDLGWYIPRKKLDLQVLLDSLVNNNGNQPAAYQAVNRQYQLLKKHLLRYYELEKQYNWETIVIKEKSLRPGDSSASLPAIRQRLHWLGDLAMPDSSTIYDEAMTLAVLRFQKRHGLTEDSAMGPAFFRQLNTKPSTRIRQLLVNMERLRWVPAETPPDYLLVNIPAFQLFVFKNDSLQWSMNVVVGSTAHNTVIFRGDMKYIVFSPYWNVPRSIVRSEIEPALRKDSAYLRKNNMERNAGGIRQKPGPGNALGLVKFLFPNQYNIYLHDTPAKSLFARDRRAFSHGCIRLEQARKLAEYLLAENPKWTREEMDKAMQAGKETWVTLEKTIPVFIGYFTAWESSDGLLHFRDDIYDHDRKLAARLFK